MQGRASPAPLILCMVQYAHEQKKKKTLVPFAFLPFPSPLTLGLFLEPAHQNEMLNAHHPCHRTSGLHMQRSADLACHQLSSCQSCWADPPAVSRFWSFGHSFKADALQIGSVGEHLMRACPLLRNRPAPNVHPASTCLRACRHLEGFSCLVHGLSDTIRWDCACARTGKHGVGYILGLSSQVPHIRNRVQGTSAQPPWKGGPNHP